MEIEFENIPNEYDLTGHIIEFDEPLVIHNPNIPDKDGRISIFPENGVAFETKYMMATGGFGCHSYTMGRMIIGWFGRTPEDCLDKNKCISGNTKDFPTKQSKEIFKVKECD